MASAVQDNRSDENGIRQARRDLAACYRLCALFGWDDHIATHISARLPDGTFLLNPFGLLFEEITASTLMRIDMDGNPVGHAGSAMNPAAFTIHSAVLAGRDDVNCVLHLHTRDGTAVSALKEGLLPLNQTALTISHDIAYHDFEGIATDLDERERLQADLGEKNLMLLRNHGTLTVGPSIGSAFYRMYALEWACAAQVRTLSMAREINLPAQQVQDSMAREMRQAGGGGQLHRQCFLAGDAAQGRARVPRLRPLIWPGLALACPAVHVRRRKCKGVNGMDLEVAILAAKDDDAAGLVKAMNDGGSAALLSCDGCNSVKVLPGVENAGNVLFVVEWGFSRCP